MLKDRNPAYSKLLNQRKIVEEVIEDVVKFQHGGLNNSVDTMSEVVREYTRGRDDIQGLRKSLAETQAVLTAKKVGQVPLKELWQKKVELQETLRMVKDLESLKVLLLCCLTLQLSASLFIFIFTECTTSSTEINAAETISYCCEYTKQGHHDHVWRGKTLNSVKFFVIFIIFYINSTMILWILYVIFLNIYVICVLLQLLQDLVGVRGLSVLREQLMDLKEGLLETCVGELKSAVVASGAELMMKDYASGSDSEVGFTF